MTSGEAVNWIINISADIGKAEHRDLWHYEQALSEIREMLEQLPSAQPDLSEAYAKAVWTWLLDYQIKAAELNGKYSPYEVLSWVANDWRKEHE